CPCGRGAGAISAGQIRSKSAMSAAICSGGAGTVRSWWFLIFIRPHLWLGRLVGVIAACLPAVVVTARVAVIAAAGGTGGRGGGEPEDGGGVEVEHLRAGELPVPDLVEAQCFHVEPLAVRSQAPLVPEHDDLLVGRRDDPRVHPPFVLGWLQPVPHLVEAGPI